MKEKKKVDLLNTFRKLNCPILSKLGVKFKKQTYIVKQTC